MAEMSATQAVSVGKQTNRVYVGRIIRVDKDVVKNLIGVASHEAWKTLARKHKSLKVPRGEHNQLTGLLMKTWCWEIVASKIG